MRKIVIIFSLFLLIFPTFNSYSQRVDSVERKLNVPGLIATGSITPLALAGVYVYMDNAWWSGRRSVFHFDGGSDLHYARNLDKLGHFTASCFVSNAFSDILQVFNVPENWSMWGGATLGVLNATVIEIKDGYSPFWGFSIYDEIANVLGAFYPVLQAKVPFFRNFNFKWSYDWDYSYETEYYKYKASFNLQDSYSFIDDYDRQYFWMTVDWANLFCKEKSKYKFPYCIDLAIGMSARNLKTLDPSKEIQQEFFIGFDVNLTKFFQNRNVGYYICKYLNFYHLPMPSLRVFPEGKVFWIGY